MDADRETTGMQILIKMGLFWIIFIACVALFFNDFNEKKYNPNQSISVNSSGELTLKRNKWGHYVTDGQINHQNVVLMLDTGATNVVIPRLLAKQLGLEKGLKSKAYTANGPVTTFDTVLDSLSIGVFQGSCRV